MDYIACQAPLSMGFSRQEYCSGLPFPSPGDLPNPGIKPGSPVLQTDSLLTELWGKPFCLSKRLCQSDCLTPHIWIVHILANIGYYLCLKMFDKLMDRICIWLFTLWFFNCKQAWSCFFLPFKSFFYKLIFQIPTPVLLPGKSHGWRSLVGCSPWGCEQSDMTEWLHFYFSLSLFTFMHWRRKWQPTPVFLPGESQGQGSLVGCHLWGRTESDMTEAT